MLEASLYRQRHTVLVSPKSELWGVVEAGLYRPDALSVTQPTGKNTDGLELHMTIVFARS